MLHCSVRAHPGGNVSIPFKGAVMQRSTADFSSLRASTLKIEAVQNLHRRSPYHPAAPLIRRDDAGADVDVVKVICSDGITGLGEGTTIGGLSYGAESPEGMKLAIDQYIAPILKSASPARVPETMIAIRKAIKGNNFAKCAVETALLDAWGKRVGLPVSELVGGRLRDRLPAAWTLASGDTAVDIAEAEQMLERKRHNAFKLKIGRRPIDEDVAHVAAVKRALGNTASVRVDVNMAWSEVEANKGLAALEAAWMRHRRAARRKSRRARAPRPNVSWFRYVCKDPHWSAYQRCRTF
jgi:muconate cycloisomerase